MWTFAMNDALIDAYLHQHTMGYRLGETFTTHALENIGNELKGKFLDKPTNKEKTQNHVRNMKRTFT